MIQTFVDRFVAHEADIRAGFAAAHPVDYQAIVKLAIAAVTVPEENYEDDCNPDPDRIHEINDGEYQGTLVYIIAAKGYQPSRYWSVFVAYGSCSGCDTLEDLRDYSDEPPTPEQINGYWTLALHIVQGIRLMSNEVV